MNEEDDGNGDDDDDNDNNEGHDMTSRVFGCGMPLVSRHSLL